MVGVLGGVYSDLGDQYRVWFCFSVSREGGRFFLLVCCILILFYRGATRVCVPLSLGYGCVVGRGDSKFLDDVPVIAGGLVVVGLLF